MRIKFIKGFTLVEVLTTVTILFSAIFFIHQGFARCLQAIKHSEESLLGSLLLEKPAVSLAIQGWFPAEDMDKSASAEKTTDYPGYSLSVQAAPHESNEFVKLESYRLRSQSPTGRSWEAGLLSPEDETDEDNKM